MSPVPDLVSRYLARNVPDPPPQHLGTLLHQRGELRLGPDRGWMPFTAEQLIRATTTEFIWHARFRMAPMVTGVVEDALEDGMGRLDAKLWGVVPVAHERGVDIDRGEAERYLAELPWCPLALTHNPEIHLEPRDEDTVRAWVYDRSTWVDLTFDGQGDIVAARTTTRTRTTDSGEGVAQPWEGRFGDYHDFGDLRAPRRGEVRWQGPDGDFVYWRGEVVDLGWHRPDD